MNRNAPPLSAPDNRVKLSWHETHRKNRAQANSVFGGSIIMMVSGVHISYGIFNINLNTTVNLAIVQSSWYVGVILAGFAAHFFIDKWEKKIFYYIGAVSCAVGSCMFFEPMVNYEECIILGRFLAGIGHGIVYMPLVIHSGENSVKEMRGMVLSSINYCIMMSMAISSFFILMINSGSIYFYTDPNLFIAILGLVYSAMAFIFIPMLFYESPLFLIRQNRDREALVNMIKLRSEQTESMEIRTDFEDFRQMIQEDKQTSSNIFSDNNMRPLLFVTVSKLLHSLSFNYPLNLIRLTTVLLSIFLTSNDTYFWIPISLLLTRVLVGLVPLYGMDTIGRKILFSISASFCGITIIILGFYFISNYNINMDGLLVIMCFIVFDILSTLGIGMVPDVLASEAFPINKKSLSITFANTVDTIFNIILIIVTPHVALYEGFISSVLIGFGAILVLGAIIFYSQLPETKKMSLRQSRDVFRGRTSQQLSQAHHNNVI